MPQSRVFGLQMLQGGNVSGVTDVRTFCIGKFQCDYFNCNNNNVSVYGAIMAPITLIRIIIALT